MRSNHERGDIVYALLEPITGRYSSSCPPLVRDSVILGFMGFGIFSITFGGYGLFYDEFYLPEITPGMTMRPYGLEWGVQAIVAGLLGMATGWSIAFSLHRHHLIAALLCIVASAATAIFSLSIWKEKVAVYGPDASDALLFPPLLFLSGAALALVAVVSAALGISVRARIQMRKTD